jgi:hypothetical protein
MRMGALALAALAVAACRTGEAEPPPFAGDGPRTIAV